MKRVVLFGVVFALVTMIAPSQVYVRSVNLWDRFLEGNCESLLIAFQDGTCLVLTEERSDRVLFPWEEIFKDHTPKECIFVIHNHLGIGRWSDADNKIYRDLKKAGFHGAYMCRLGTGTVIRKED